MSGCSFFKDRSYPENVTDNRRDLLCGNWESVEGKPDVLIYKEGEAYKVRPNISVS